MKPQARTQHMKPKIGNDKLAIGLIGVLIIAILVVIIVTIGGE